MPPTIGTLVSARLATLAELDSVYGLQDMWDLLEVHSVDSHNKRMAEKHAQRNQ